VLFAALLYIYRVTQTTTVAPVTEEYIEDGRPHVLQDSYCLLRNGATDTWALSFGATEKLSDATVDAESLHPL
jgi:SulP family sulfate permease